MHTADNDNPPEPRRWWWALGAGGAVAAAIALVAFQPRPVEQASSTYVVATANGERKTVMLGDGTRIELGGGTAITLDRADDRRRVARSRRGRLPCGATMRGARSRLPPAASRCGTSALSSISGLSIRVLQIAVAEGSVMLRPEREALRLGPGEAAALDTRTGRIARDAGGAGAGGRMAH